MHRAEKISGDASNFTLCTTEKVREAESDSLAGAALLNTKFHAFVGYSSMS